MVKAVETRIGAIFESSRDAVVRVEVNDQLGKVSGTGFFTDSSGLIYTLASLVGDGLGLKVIQGDRELSARLLAKDPRSGIALIKVDEVESTPFLLKGDCRDLRPSSGLVLVGFPYEHDVSPSFGLVGGFDLQLKGKFFTTTHIRANIPVQRGQGGSPVLNLDGEVVGVLVSSFEEGAGCYVLPIRAAEKVRHDYVRFGDVRHGWAGVTVRELPLPVQGSRVAIDLVDPTGPAASKFHTGDVILQVGEIEVHHPEDALDASFFLTAELPVDVRIARDGEIRTIPFLPGQHPSGRKSDLQALGPTSLTSP